jgi:hypothetical protein
MFEDWKQAWRQAVENFRRELRESEEGDGAPPDVRAMRRDVVSARGALEKLDDEITRTRRDAVAEREQETICRRREGLARNIGDAETARLAAEFALRHVERAVLFERKVAVLEEERTLLRRDLGLMEEALSTRAPASAESVTGGARPDVLEDRERQDRDFAQFDREAREKAAQEKLEELKRRMR